MRCLIAFLVFACPLYGQTVSSQLSGKTRTEQLQIKGQETAKLLDAGAQSGSAFNYDFVTVQATAVGIQVQARVSRKNGDRIGFGPDCSVDIETFHISDIPIYVPDPKGSYVRTDDDGKQTTYREDPKAALLIWLDKIVATKASRCDGSRIISGTVGRSTGTVRSGAGDGIAERGSADSTFATIRAATGNNGISNGTNNPVRISSSTTSDQYTELRRGLSDYAVSTACSGSPCTGTVTSASLTLTCTAKTNGLGDSSYVVAQGNMATSTVASGDYQNNVGPTEFSTVAQASVNTTGTTVFTFDADGIAAVQSALGGTLELAHLTGFDHANSAPTWGSSQSTGYTCYWADQGGTTDDPLLTLETLDAGVGARLRKGVGR